MESCRALLRRLGNPVICHNFRQGNRLADSLAKEESLLEVNNVTCILEAAPEDAHVFCKLIKMELQLLKVLHYLLVLSLQCLET